MNSHYNHTNNHQVQSNQSAPIFARKQEYSLPPPEAAVRARGIVLSAGQGADTSLVLNGLTLTVPVGAIYGLLGPSGCGKTR